jgi:hypothetical protein
VAVIALPDAPETRAAALARLRHRRTLLERAIRALERFQKCADCPHFDPATCQPQGCRHTDPDAA